MGRQVPIAKVRFMSATYKIFSEQSQKLDMEIYDSCVNIPDWFIAYDDGISGFHTHGSCVIAYSVGSYFPSLSDVRTPSLNFHAQ